LPFPTFPRKMQSGEECEWQPQFSFLTCEIHFPYLCFLKTLMHTHREAFSRSIPAPITAPPLPQSGKSKYLNYVEPHPPPPHPCPSQTSAQHHAEQVNVPRHLFSPTPCPTTFLPGKLNELALITHFPRNHIPMQVFIMSQCSEDSK
jgi:hypothetical protein